MKIGVVRGPFLNKWEMQMYEPLALRHGVTGFTTTSHFYDISKINMKIKTLGSPDSFLHALSPAASSFFNRACNKLFGFNYYIRGLEENLAGMDVVNTAETFHTFTAQVMKAKEKYGFKTAVTVWENIPFTFEKHPRRIKNKERAFAFADVFLAVSNLTKECLLKEGVAEQKIKVLFPAINTDAFKPMPRDENTMNLFGLNKDDFVVLFAGRFVPDKGVYHLLAAVKKIIEDISIKTPVKFLFAGDGPERENMKRYADMAGISESIVISRGFDYGKMPFVYSVADIFVLPSVPMRYWLEQFGYVLAEALACGKPVVSTLTGAIPEVVGDAGILVPPGDSSALYSAIKKIITDENFREQLGLKARMRAEEKFNAVKTAAELEKVYEGLLKNGR